ncbi:fluoride efflux transporter FluC [Nocardioides massiliensis]|uniref:Fluoride-specific ion channel FluC n=1 Tax=Nocardioides massiliensis TaxID=1325935 RepID=A0ABT9NSY1_9ACTN|nr:CrcB family protein [Nocardioides massiliensis]MDP9823289.1 CrcB protein [Nocardioides massiliensis]
MPSPPASPCSDGDAAPSRTSRRHRARTAREQAPVFAAVAVGGGIGAVARYAAGVTWPTYAGAFPWTTLAINGVGCAVIGVFMVLITDVWTPHRLVRPFFGTGVLGGFTTFSTYAIKVQRSVDEGHALLGLTYMMTTPLVALAAVWSSAAVTRRLLMTRRSSP